MSPIIAMMSRYRVLVGGAAVLIVAIAVIAVMATSGSGLTHQAATVRTSRSLPSTSLPSTIGQPITTGTTGVTGTVPPVTQVATSTTAQGTQVSTPTTTPAKVPSVTVPPVLPPPSIAAPTAQMLSAATGYINAYENAYSYYQTSPRTWMTQARPFMSPQAFTTLSQSISPVSNQDSYEYSTTHQYKWKVASSVTCVPDQEVATTNPTIYTLICTVTDQTVDATGQPVTASALPPVWSLNGSQPAIILAMVNNGQSWLVNEDQTGQT